MNHFIEMYWSVGQWLPCLDELFRTNEFRGAKATQTPSMRSAAETSVERSLNSHEKTGIQTDNVAVSVASKMPQSKWPASMALAEQRGLCGTSSEVWLLDWWDFDTPTISRIPHDGIVMEKLPPSEEC